jgi:two-component system chemotaxis response regulator CheB
MPPIFTKALADKLNMNCSMKVKEARDGEPVLPDTVYIAPGGKQMKVLRNSKNEKVIGITEDPPENSCRPSADYLFRSIALVYGPHSTGVIMTGMGSDGVRGLREMKEAGATVIAQDESTCVVYGMPREAIKAGIVDIVAPLNQMAEEIVKTVRH